MLVIWGENDELFPLAEGEAFAKSTGARFEVIPQCGHAPQLDAPTEFSHRISTFLE